MGDAADPRELIDLARYPIDDLAGEAGAALVAHCRSRLEAAGACRLDGFLTPAAVERLTAEALALAPGAFPSEVEHNVWFSEVPEDAAADDPRRRMERASQTTVAYDEIPAGAGIRAVYEWEQLTRFLGAVFGRDPLYRNADPLGALNLVYYRDGDELGWHFDDADFVVTLMLQPAADGGDFEYVPWLRSADDPNVDGVVRLLDGDRSQVVVSPSQAGALALFRGRHSIHRVTPIRGDVLRANAVLSYAERPGEVLAPLTQQLFYGRTG